MSEPATPTRAQAAAQRRAATVESLRASGALACPAALPLAARRDDLMAAIRDHQVVIVAGETGSGKSTQLPKLCLDLGRGVAGLVGHTQPRRMAARTIAERVAEELGTELGATVGYTVRFTDTVGEQTLVKVMTDGILLAEIQRDRMLRRYDTLIIDEAHERSLNIDFLLGYLAQLLPKRPDLKLIVTSATIDTQRFSEHFAQPDGRPAPIIEVSGRTFPVEVRYRPFGARDDDPDDDRDQVQAIVDAVDELAHEGDGDVLVFLSGEREIHDTADALRRHFTESARTARGARRAAAVCAPVGRRAASHLATAPRPTGGALHQRGRDIAHRARGAVRGRCRRSAHVAVQPSAEGATPAHRSGLAGIGQPTRRSLRPRGARHLHPAVRRSRLR